MLIIRPWGVFVGKSPLERNTMAKKEIGNTNMIMTMMQPDTMQYTTIKSVYTMSTLTTLSQIHSIATQIVIPETVLYVPVEFPTTRPSEDHTFNRSPLPSTGSLCYLKRMDTGLLA